jgi:hypothetical protein
VRVSDAGRLIYLNPPRTGSTKVGWLMKITWDDVWQPREQSGHHTVWKPAWEGYFILQTVRSPFTRAVSLWRRAVEALAYRNAAWLEHLDNGKISFKDFLHHEHDDIKQWWAWCPCTNFNKGVPPVDLIVHQENLTEELKAVPGLKSEGKHMMASKMQTPWHEHYADPACIDKVLELFASDFERYGYTRDIERAKEGEFFPDDCLSEA